MPRPGTPRVHPRLMGDLERGGWFNKTCTIQARANVEDSWGQGRATSWVTLEGHENLSCRMSVVTTGGMGFQSERETLSSTDVIRRRVVQMDGIYPAITEKHSAVVDGTQYDIEDVRTDSEGTHTVLIVEHVTGSEQGEDIGT